MPLDHSVVGRYSEPVLRYWDPTAAILYALGVGAGQRDPAAELVFTTENSADVEQRVLPTFAVVLMHTRAVRRPFGDGDRAPLGLHAAQALTLHRPLTPAGGMRVTSRVTGIHDKGSGALVITESEAVDPATGERIASTRSDSFIRGEGGFGGSRGPADGWERPSCPADLTIEVATRADQALLYRLSGDRNPLHSDPKSAAQAGFPRPILHGMCTYGIAGRILLHHLCAGEPARFRSMSGRFTRPVLPGDTLTLSVWVTGGTATFQMTAPDGAVALDRGVFTFNANAGTA
jgi:acyl dehydratase